jgi:hypothetical protein
LNAEVTVGDALDLLADDLRAAVRRHVGRPAETLAAICDEVTDEVCRQWPLRWANSLARRTSEPTSGQELVDGLAVIRARVRETIEARLGCGDNDQRTLDLLLPSVTAAVAWFWFDSRETRARVRRAVWHVRHD